MNFNELADESEDAEHSPAERIAAASRSTWVSVFVNLILTISKQKPSQRKVIYEL